jgi:hypothetical protein
MARKNHKTGGCFGCPPGIRTPIGCSRGSCPTIERGGKAVDSLKDYHKFYFTYMPRECGHRPTQLKSGEMY